MYIYIYIYIYIWSLTYAYCNMLKKLLFSCSAFALNTLILQNIMINPTNFIF